MKPADRITIGVFGNTSKPSMVESIRPVLEILHGKGVDFLVEDAVAAALKADPNRSSQPVPSAPREFIAEHSNFIMTFGGDGTLLGAVQYALHHDTPVLGVNLGKLGFLTDITVDGIRHAIDMLLARRFLIEERITLTGRMREGGGEFHALNDVVVSKSGAARVVKIHTMINEDFLATFYADGIIFATPTGSTAYSLATGGPIVTPATDVIVISPISAHTLTARPMIIPCSSRISVTVEADEGSVMVMYDGHIASQNMQRVNLAVARGEKSVKLVKQPESNYYEMLRSKLSWAHDSRSAVKDK